jgi:hypothetical protein
MSFRWRLLVVVAPLLLTACAAAGSNGDNDRHGGFYGGVSGGWAQP